MVDDVKVSLYEKLIKGVGIDDKVEVEIKKGSLVIKVVLIFGKIFVDKIVLISFEIYVVKRDCVMIWENVEIVVSSGKLVIDALKINGEKEVVIGIKF